MKGWVPLINAVDTFNKGWGKLASWAVFVACMVSAGNASVRYAFSKGSNAFLEVQWYLFAATVMLGAAYVLKLNEHVRVDVIYGPRSPRTKAWIDVFGLVFFLLPSMIALVYYSYPLFAGAWNSGEMSSNAGGLIRWPAFLLMPLGFALVSLQGFVELLKRIGFLQGWYNMDTHYERPLQ